MIKDKPEWFCSECGDQFEWNDDVVLVSGGSINVEHNGPAVDNNAWWDVYHQKCYNTQKS